LRTIRFSTCGGGIGGGPIVEFTFDKVVVEEQRDKGVWEYAPQKLVSLGGMQNDTLWWGDANWG